MRDLSRRACPDHPCDQCATCRSGRCCLNDSPMPSASAVDKTTLWLFGSMLGDTNRASEADQQVAAPQPDPVETHQIVWVANEPQSADPTPSADEAIRDRERRTRERWTDAPSTRARVDVHHHVHAQPADAEPDDEIIDAEVVESDDSSQALGSAGQRALPRSSPRYAFETDSSQEVRRDGR